MWEMSFTSSGAALTFSGRVTGGEIIEAKAAFFAYDFPDESRYVICDFTPAETFDVSSEDVQRIVDQDKSAMASHPLLLEAVVASTTLQYGLSRMWQQRVDEVRPHTGVVRTRTEALDWLRSRGVADSAHIEVAGSSAATRDHTSLGGAKGDGDFSRPP